MGAFDTFQSVRMFAPSRRLSKSSGSSGGSKGSISSARSAASSMTDQQLDNFRSMRGKSAGNFIDSAYSMVDDVFDLEDRLVDVKKGKELEKRVVDATGQAYAILVTTTDVRLQHTDDHGVYHYNHFGSEKPAKHARDLGQRRDPVLVKECWTIIDDDATGHVFATITPRHVTIYHHYGIWRCRRVGGVCVELEDSDSSRPSMKKKLPRPGGLNVRRPSQTKVFKLYGANDDSVSRSGAPAVEALLCANTPGERDESGQHPRAHQSFYHDL